jgi:hypothetical protein
LDRTAEVQSVVVVIVVVVVVVVVVLVLVIVLVELIFVASSAAAHLKHNFGPLCNRLVCKLFVETF